MAEQMIVCDGLVKIYKTKAVEVLALQGLDMSVEKGELMVSLIHLPYLKK